MTAGLPGIGIGGVFYLSCALLMPVVELVRRARGRGTRRPWRTVLLPSLLAWGTLGALGATGWLVGALLVQAPAAIIPVADVGPGALTQAGETYGLPSAAAGLATLSLLVLVLGGVQVLRSVVAPAARGPLVRSQAHAWPGTSAAARPLANAAAGTRQGTRLDAGCHRSGSPPSTNGAVRAK